MNWVDALINLYDKNEAIAGKEVFVKKPFIIKSNKKGNTPENEKGEKVILAPIYHEIFSVMFEFQLNEDGDLQNITQINKEEQDTLIPVTQESISRTSTAIAPHTLSEQLNYLSGNNLEKYEKYVANLQAWCDSPYGHPKIVAILKYIKKKTILSDLTRYGHNYNDKDLVRFCVTLCNDNQPQEVWKDKNVQNQYIKFIDSQNETQKKDFCYITGEMLTPAKKHPKKITVTAGNAKLISANDEHNYTFRGRFTDTDGNQALRIGYNTSQKFHNALKWIIKKQGRFSYGSTFVLWESELNDIPSLDSSSIEIENSLGLKNLAQKESTPGDTNYIDSQKFHDLLLGYCSTIPQNSSMYVLVTEAVTTGRLSLTYFKEFNTSIYIKNLAYWHKTCSWTHFFGNEVKKVGMISLYDCIRLLYGHEENSKIELKTSKNNVHPLFAKTFYRLLPCVLLRKNIPFDLVCTAYQRASSPLCYQRNNWEAVLNLACSLIKKYRYERYKEEWSMALDESCADRNYLFGRLLAVADRIEYLTYEKGKDNSRQTNAKRYMNIFAKSPFRTWSIINKNIQPYLNKLEVGSRIYYSDLLNSIHDMFIDIEDYSSNKPLDGRYLLGFHCQSSIMKNKIENNQNLKENEE